jgi:hypothetical protein
VDVVVRVLRRPEVRYYGIIELAAEGFGYGVASLTSKLLLGHRNRGSSCARTVSPKKRRNREEYGIGTALYHQIRSHIPREVAFVDVHALISQMPSHPPP